MRNKIFNLTPAGKRRLKSALQILGPAVTTAVTLWAGDASAQTFTTWTQQLASNFDVHNATVAGVGILGSVTAASSYVSVKNAVKDGGAWGDHPKQIMAMILGAGGICYTGWETMLKNSVGLG